MTTVTNNQFKILLVDDREENLISLEAILDSDNRTLIKVQSGNEALKQTMKHDDIGLIMLDVQMPDMDGLEASRRITARWPAQNRPRIIAMTANAMAGDRELCIAAGMRVESEFQ